MDFVKKSLKIILVVAFILGLIVSAFIGYNAFYNEILGVTVGIVVSFVVQTLVYGIILTIIDIAETNNAILKALTNKDTASNSTSNVSPVNAFAKQEKAAENITVVTPVNENELNSKNSWVCSKCGNKNPNGTIFCAHCGK